MDSICFIETMPYFLRGQSHHANYFIAAAVAGRNGNGRSRHLQKFCEEFDAGLIGSSLDWRRGERELEGIAEFAGDGVLFRARVNFDGEAYALVAVLDWNHHGRMPCNSEAREGRVQLDPGELWAGEPVG